MSEKLVTAEEARNMLNETTPGPWKFEEHDEWEHVAGNEYPAMQVTLEHSVQDEEGEHLFGAFNNYKTLEHPGNLPLATAAPDLARTVIEQAEQIKRLQGAIEHLDEFKVDVVWLTSRGVIKAGDME